ncbi:DUF3458 domain-containing protein [Acidihalobacter yilgarnensis]|uniref:DUF3458 domain-containing protein n=1 Tax=Acidihalobacter yilgarnensis TaxID=2819280 RepID=UPI002AC87727|nr:DUF3458 domain-containing protein [Acidihalobacter yilgarnensis]
MAVEDEWEPEAGRYTLRLRQSCSPTPGQPVKLPFLIPLRIGLVGPDGADLPMRLEGETDGGATDRVFRLSDAEQVLCFTGLPVRPVPSLNRGFSAPIRVEYPYVSSTLAFLAAHDNDPFNRWDAGERLALSVLLDLVEDVRAGRALALPAGFVEAFAAVLGDECLEPNLRAEMLSLPGEAWLAEQFDTVDPDAIHAAREYVRRALATELEAQWLVAYHGHAPEAVYRYTPDEAGRRALRNLALVYLASLDSPAGARLAETQFHEADNMTDAMGALGALMLTEDPAYGVALAAFYERWQSDTLVLNKWFGLQAARQHSDTLAEVERLMAHPAFSLGNPNRVYALLGGFMMANPTGFHAADGSGYRFAADQVLALDARNPQVAARLVKVFSRWRRYDVGRQALMRAELERLKAQELSPDVYEIVSKSLADAA